MIYTGGPKKFMNWSRGKIVWKILKFVFDGVFLSIYSQLLKNLELSKLCKKNYGALKIQKMACSQLVKNLKKK